MTDSNKNPLHLTDYLNYLEEKKSKKSRKKKKKKKQTMPSLYLGGLGDPTGDGAADGDSSGDGGGGMGESFTLKEALRFYWKTEYDQEEDDENEDQSQFVDDEDFEADFDDDEDIDREDIEKARDFEEDEEEASDSKKLKAIEIYNGMTNAERSDIIRRFMDELAMTEDTAKTYYQNINSGRWTKEDFTDEEEDEGGQASQDEEEQPDEGGEEGLEDELDPEEDNEPDEPEDPDRQGLIRTVKGAHLVYKRQAEDGSYEELWTYNIDKDVRNELKIRRDILAGTDIPPNKRQSDDGTQHYNLWTVGNVQMLHIEGLPN